jgi:hypothetical protein
MATKDMTQKRPRTALRQPEWVTYVARLEAEVERLQREAQG